MAAGRIQSDNPANFNYEWRLRKSWTEGISNIITSGCPVICAGKMNDYCLRRDAPETASERVQ
eukprot:12524282-Alexandrium_andersonii.AAC.1